MAVDNAQERMMQAATQRKGKADQQAQEEVLPAGQQVYLKDHSQRGRIKIQDVWAPEVFLVVKLP